MDGGSIKKRLCMRLDPNPDSPLNNSLADTYRTDRRAYTEIVKKEVSKSWQVFEAKMKNEELEDSF